MVLWKYFLQLTFCCLASRYKLELERIRQRKKSFIAFFYEKMLNVMFDH